MKKFLLIILVVLLPQLMFAQGAGGQIKRPNKKSQPIKKNSKPTQKSASNKNSEALMDSKQNVSPISRDPNLRSPTDMELNKMLRNPFGKVNVDMWSSSHQTIVNVLSESYMIETNEADGIKANLTCRDHYPYPTYCGFSLEDLSVCTYHTGERCIQYYFHAYKSDIPDAYANFEQIIYDFNQMGIPLTPVKKDDKYEKASAEIKMGSIKYEINLYDAASWNLYIIQKINY